MSDHHSTPTGSVLPPWTRPWRLEPTATIIHCNATSGFPAYERRSLSPQEVSEVSRQPWDIAVTVKLAIPKPGQGPRARSNLSEVHELMRHCMNGVNRALYGTRWYERSSDAPRAVAIWNVEKPQTQPHAHGAIRVPWPFDLAIAAEAFRKRSGELALTFDVAHVQLLATPYDRFKWLSYSFKPVDWSEGVCNAGHLRERFGIYVGH